MIILCTVIVALCFGDNVLHERFRAAGDTPWWAVLPFSGYAMSWKQRRAK